MNAEFRSYESNRTYNIPRAYMLDPGFFFYCAAHRAKNIAEIHL